MEVYTRVAQLIYNSVLKSILAAMAPTTLKNACQLGWFILKSLIENPMPIDAKYKYKDGHAQ
jgi:hypothetical protein